MRWRVISPIEDQRMLADDGQGATAKGTACPGRDAPVVLWIVVQHGGIMQTGETLFVSPKGHGLAVGRRRDNQAQRRRPTTRAFLKTANHLIQVFSSCQLLLSGRSGFDSTPLRFHFCLMNDGTE